MDYIREEMKDEGFEDSEVAACLAYLAGFPKGTAFKRTGGVHLGSGRTVLVFHSDTVAEDPDLYLATRSPDIYVSCVLGGKYVIDFNKRVDPSLIAQLPESLRRGPPQL